MNRIILILLAVAVFSAGNDLAVAATPQQDQERVQWNYEVPAGVRRIVHQDQKRWILQFPNGTSHELLELDRTDQYIELRNESNQNVMRLFDEFGTIRPADGTAFRRFTEGRWVTSAPVTAADYEVHLVYFVPSDREPTAHYESKIRAIAELMEQVFANDLKGKGFQVIGPRFHRQRGKIVVDLIRGQRGSRFYNQNGAWKSNDHADAIFSEVDRLRGNSGRRMTLIFAETYELGDAPLLWAGHIALAVAKPPTGGIAVFSAWILRDEFAASDPAVLRQRFFDQTPIPGRTALGNRVANSPRSDFLEDGIGGAIHELAHMFGLTHHSRGRPNHIMAQGFRNLRWNVGVRSNPRLAATFSDENAAILMTSRFINEAVDRSDHRPPEVALDVHRSGKQLQVTVRCRDETQLARLTLVDVTAASGRELLVSGPLTGKEQTVRLSWDSSTLRGPESSLQAIVIDGGGNFTKVTKKPQS